MTTGRINQVTIHQRTFPTRHRPPERASDGVGKLRGEGLPSRHGEAGADSLQKTRLSQGETCKSSRHLPQGTPGRTGPRDTSRSGSAPAQGGPATQKDAASLPQARETVQLLSPPSPSDSGAPPHRPSPSHRPPPPPRGGGGSGGEGPAGRRGVAGKRSGGQARPCHSLSRNLQHPGKTTGGLSSGREAPGPVPPHSSSSLLTDVDPISTHINSHSRTLST